MVFAKRRYQGSNPALSAADAPTHRCSPAQKWAPAARNRALTRAGGASSSTLIAYLLSRTRTRTATASCWCKRFTSIRSCGT
jgi:hypothetical protein